MFEAFALRGDRALDAREVSEYSGVSWATVHRRIREWETLGLIEFAWKKGKAEKYRLNLESRTVHILAQAVQSAVQELFESDLASEGLALASQSLEEVTSQFHSSADEFTHPRDTEGLTGDHGIPYRVNPIRRNRTKSGSPVRRQHYTDLASA